MIRYFSFGKIGPFYTWGLFLALGFLAGLVFVLRQAKEERIKKELVWDLFWWVLVGSVVGMRLGYVLQFPQKFFSNPVEIVKIWDGGLTFYGGLSGGIIGALYFKKVKNLNSKEFGKMADLIALSAPLGIIIARIGCFLINDHQGALTSLPWGIVWPDGQIRHPVALYLIINGVLLYYILEVVKPFLKKEGQVFLFFLLFYSLSRFFLDFTRSVGTELSDPHYLFLSISQCFSVFVFLLSLIILIAIRKQPKLIKASDKLNCEKEKRGR